MVSSPKQQHKQTWYPQPHRFNNSAGFDLSGTTKLGTIIPIAFYDEGLGAPSGNQTHPENSSFAEYGGANCYVDSKISLNVVQLEFKMTKQALETDKIHALKVAFMPIMLSFKENYEAIDEATALEIQDVLEMQKESTDRQGYPLYDGTKLTEKYTNSALYHANHPGLTTTQKAENVAFNLTNYYKTLNNLTTSGKLKKAQGGLKYITLTRTRPTRTIRIKLRSKVKRMNPYTFFGVALMALQADSPYSHQPSADYTAGTHVWYDFRTIYNEWNEGFGNQKV